MKLVIQRAFDSSVTVQQEDGTWLTTGSFEGDGLVVLVGIDRFDVQSDVDYLSKRLCEVRIWSDENGRPWSRGLVHRPETNVILVSQFTLYAAFKGAKPDFHNALDGKFSNPIFDSFVASVRKQLGADRVSTGVFGGNMRVKINNDGPVTLEIDSRLPNYVAGMEGLTKVGGVRAAKEIEVACEERGLEVPEGVSSKKQQKPPKNKGTGKPVSE